MGRVKTSKPRTATAGAVFIEEIVIKNFAIIEEARLRPAQGLNIFTGETGAGKSILAESLAFVFGHLNNVADLLRAGAGSLEVSVVIAAEGAAGSAPPAPQVPRSPGAASESLGLLFEEMGLAWPEDGRIALRRVFEKEAGKSRSYANDTPVSLLALKKMSAGIIEMHYQNSQAALIESSFALDYLDGWAQIKENLRLWRRLYDRWVGLRQELDYRQQHADTKLQELSFLRHQYEEIVSLGMNDEILRQLEQDLPLWIASSQMTEELCRARLILNEDETNVLSRLAHVRQRLARAGQFVKEPAGADSLTPPAFQAINEAIEQAQTFTQDAQAQISRLIDRLNYDPARLEEMLTTKTQLERLLKKYNRQNWAELKELAARLQEQMKGLENSETDNAGLAAQIKELEAQLIEQAKVFSRQRAKAAGELSILATEHLQALGLSGAHLRFELSTAGSAPQGPQTPRSPGAAGSLQPKGFEQCCLLFAPNAGEGFKELRHIASGGEISRVLLVLKSLMAGKKAGGFQVILFFDEIEQGLSAAMVAKVGLQFSRLAKEHQIFAITHSPVLVSFAQQHYLVEKERRNGRTVAAVRSLTAGSLRHAEARRLLGVSDPDARAALAPYLAGLQSRSSKEGRVKI